MERLLEAAATAAAMVALAILFSTISWPSTAESSAASTPTMVTLAQSRTLAKTVARAAIDIRATPVELSPQRLGQDLTEPTARDLSLAAVRGVIMVHSRAAKVILVYI
jgi:hypothetical protein